ncbi:unnamed protein product (macronuclear) [Paramecium tetraurelia]|uniref:Uncharacterized protein n=1 Tax=Paramecium tetraurelia TaxID=5888 RepID=A0DSQ5_PARTE|nr:uncharacterized protein GSPATT00019765001 [Paramecium tetraurelia]CAK86072.1 unnamed protein product [Paramecium tetraurelia]|eukprot:XP_001453469.1 hypothetical protein (macronuclear) [Paramecium tetraurelia strain d4-2]
MSGYKQYDDVEPYRQRIRDLEAQLQRMDVRFSNVLTHSGKADTQFNNDLHVELEKMTKQMIQKRSEAELWKQKYEQQLSSSMQMRNNYELELQQLSKEVQRLLDKIDQFEYEKRLNDKQLVRETLQDKDLEIDDLVSKLQRMRLEHENESQRLLSENDNLRHKINQIELDRQKELEQMRFKIETFHSQNLDNLRKTHSSQISVVESEIDKLRGLLEIKNNEIETLLQQNMKLKASYENQINELNVQFDSQKSKYQKQEIIHRDQMTQLQQQLLDEQKFSLQSLSKNYEQSIFTLEKEIVTYQKKNENLSKEIQELIVERTQLRDNYERQLELLKKDNEILKQRSAQIEQTKQKDLQQVESELFKTKQSSLEIENVYKQQVVKLENELQLQAEKEVVKNKEVETQIQQFILIKQALEEDLQHLRQQNQTLNEQIKELEKIASFEQEEWKVKWQQNEFIFKDKIRNLENKVDILHQELRKQKELADSQIRQIPEREFKALIDEIEQLKTRLVLQERDKLKEREDLRAKLEQSHHYQIENLKAAFNTQIRILEQENRDSINIITQKENTIQELLHKYQNLETAYSGQTIGPQEQASKNIYQAYIRSSNRQSSLRKQQ